MKGINKFTTTAELAERYYNEVKPGKYNRIAAVKQLPQDRHIDKKIMVRIIKEMTAEAISCLKESSEE